MKRALLSSTLLLALAACGGDNPVGTPPQPGFEVVAGGAQSDSIDAIFPASLVVRLRGPDGKPLAGAEVRFVAPLEYVPIARAPGRAYGARVWSSPISALQWSAVAFDTTDAEGLVSMRVRAGAFAGPAPLTVAGAGYSTTVTFTVAAGKQTGVGILPADTAQQVGGSFALRANGTDRHGNAVPGSSVSLSLDPNPYAQLSGATVQAVAPGRVTVRASSGALLDSAHVSIVPAGRILVTRQRFSGADTARLRWTDLDGTRAITLDRPRSGSDPAWTPSGGAVLVESDDNVLAHLFVFDSTGARRRLVDDSYGVAQEFQPQLGNDGWIYFAADAPVGQGYTELWRIRPDGSGGQRIGTPAGYYNGESQPSPSPQGDRVAYLSTWGDCCNRAALRVRNLATGVETDLGLFVSSPRWSPVDADLIAFGAEAPGLQNAYALELRVIRADGTGMRTLTPGRAYRPGFTWSPDGKWLLAQRYDYQNPGSARLELIEVATGRVIEIPGTEGYGQPAWRH